MEHKAGFVNVIDLILRGECPVDIRVCQQENTNSYGT
jgi:hypothetical protein